MKSCSSCIYSGNCYHEKCYTQMQSVCSDYKQIPTIIKIRKGINGFKYSACDEHGNFLGNFEKLADVRKHWNNEIKWGQVALVRELDQMPDMSKIESTIKNIDSILKAYARKDKR